MSLIWIIFVTKNFHNGTNIITKRYTILEFFMAPTVKTHLVSWRGRFQPFKLERKVWVIEKFWEHI